MEYMRIPKSKKDKGSIVVGLPRAFFYFRYHTLWQTFFKGLHIKTKVSAPTNLDMVNMGTKKAVSEMCLAMKIYLGHVAALADSVDYMLVPRMRDFGIRRVMCTNFESLPDIVSNTFHDASFEVLTYDIDSSKKMDERDAMIKMGIEMGFKKSEVKKAYKEALKAQELVDLKNVTETEKKYQSDGIKIAVAGHSYVIEDEYFGKPVLDYLEENGVTVVRSDFVKRKDALKMSHKVSPTLKWEISREIVGSLAMHYQDIDGVILLSVYPCALDSMVNDMLMRKNEMTKIPMLQLTLDAQSGTAGTETRLESFIDIIKMRKEAEDHGKEARS